MSVEELKEVIRQNVEDYKKYTLGAKSQQICEIGLHRAEEKFLYTCRFCGKKFCKFHGDPVQEICDSCKGRDFL